ncbi:MAG: cytoplasmic protein [Thermodesulfobacteriota bacterium]
MIDRLSRIPNPLTPLGYTEEDLFSDGFFGAVCARAGVGKTAFLVQLALWAISNEQNALHISLRDPFKKVDLWYMDIFKNLARQMEVKDPVHTWETLLPQRFIMTFKVEGFSVPKLEERMTDLMNQGIFFPNVIFIDGLSLEETGRKSLSELKDLARAHHCNVWFSVRINQYSQDLQGSAIPRPVEDFSDLFNSIILLEGFSDQIQVKNLKGGSGELPLKSICIDPSTQLLIPGK